MNHVTTPALVDSVEAEGAPVSTLPSLDAFRQAIPDTAVLAKNSIVGFDSRDNRGRAFKMMRTQFTKRIGGSGSRLIGITSAAPNAGKSFVALNLAAALSRVADQTVYLVDLDLRQASVASSLGIPVDQGVSDFLDGTCDDIASLGLRISETRLVIFPTNAIADNTAELIAGERCAQLISALRGTDEGAIVLFDLPPVFANDDAMLAVEMLDGYVLIVDSGVSTKRQVQEAISMLMPKPCVGTVLNRYKGSVFNDYGYGYGYNYGYGNAGKTGKEK